MFTPNAGLHDMHMTRAHFYSASIAQDTHRNPSHVSRLDI